MDNLIHFYSNKNGTPYQEIDSFISFSKQLFELNEDIKFEDNYWRREVNFVKVGISSKNRSLENILDHSVLEFTKAYVKYQKINSKLNPQNTILAIRVIEKICLSKYGVVDLTTLTIADFDFAAEIAKQYYSHTSAYIVGRSLKTFFDFLIKLKIIDLKNWKNPIRKPVDKSIVLNQDSEDYRAAKLPDEDAIFALAEIFSRKKSELSDRDIFVTSAVTLLLSAPERASELFFLKCDCIYEENIQSSFKSDLDSLKVNSQTEKVMGLRWYAQKNYGYDIKYIPDVMVSIVKIAVERLKKLSEKPRYFAFLLENSEKFPRHELCPEVSEDQLLTKIQVLYALGFDSSLYRTSRQSNSSGNQFLISRGLKVKDYLYCLNDLNTILRNRLPKSFPYISFETGKDIKIKWSESLFCCFSNQFHSNKLTILSELWIPHIDTLNEDLSPTKKFLRGKEQLCNVQSIFQRWGHGNYRISSHQFRHLLNTIAHTNGMDSLLLAKWSGRADIKQNRVYDHTSVEERNHTLVVMQNSEVAIREDSPLYNFQIATPRTLQELNTRTSLSILTTEFGLCTHSYIDEPCLKYRNCLNCTEHVCIKGDDEKKKRLQNRLKKEKILWQKDKLAVEKNVNGSKAWLEIRELTIQRCEQMVALLNDPNISDGTLLSLPSSEQFTHFELAYKKAGRKRLPVIKNTKGNKNDKNQILIGFALPKIDSWIS